jgi:[acyl-carrier-protein] S-malonyltransferase
MGRDLAEAYAPCRALYEEADEVLGYGLSRICFEGPIEELTKSNVCQPAIFVTSIACWQALAASGAAPPCAGAAGLSLGEWTALHMAGSLTFRDTLRVLEARGRFMQEACEEQAGGMVSVIGLDQEKLAGICAATGLEIANLNSEEQTVLSGERDAVAAAEKLAGEAGAKRTVVLQVAGAFHSRLMATAAERLQSFLADVNVAVPGVTVLSNVTGRPHGSPEDIKREMVRQVTCSVRWYDCIRWFGGKGITSYIECGPGRVLSSLIKRIDRSATLHNIQDVKSLERTRADLGVA